MSKRLETLEIVQQLNDLELAALLCFITDQHCVIQTSVNSLPQMQREIELLSRKVFGLTSAVVQCTPETTLEEFSEAVVLESADSEDEDEIESVDYNYGRNVLDNRKVANIIVAANLHQAEHNVQVQALELMRSRRIYTKSAVHTVPKHFMLVALIPDMPLSPPVMTPHLNDAFLLLHSHALSDGFPHMEAEHTPTDTESVFSQSSSAVKPTLSRQRTITNNSPHVSSKFIVELQAQIGQVQTTAEMRRHMHNIVSFLRLHRAVAGGVSAVSSRHLVLLSRALAPLHGLNYVTPSLVALAARKVFLHRIEIASADNERSLQWESDKLAVADVLRGKDGKTIIEDILQDVETPL